MQEKNRTLSKVYLRFCDYGENEGKYIGDVEFNNGTKDSFSFSINPNIANRYIELISEDVVSSASILGEKLKESLIEQGLYKNNSQ